MYFSLWEWLATIFLAPNFVVSGDMVVPVACLGRTIAIPDQRAHSRLPLGYFNGWVTGFGDVLSHSYTQKFAVDSWTSKARRCCKSIWCERTFKKRCSCSGRVSTSPFENSK